MTLPDLAPLPPFDIHVGPADAPRGLPEPQARAPLALRFSTVVENRGRHSVELIAPLPSGAPPGSADATQVWQCIRFGPPDIAAAARGCQQYRPLGAAGYDPSRGRVRLDGFGRHELRRDLAGQPDLRPPGLLRAGSRADWCLGDMENWRRDPLARSGNAPVDQQAAWAMPPPDRSWYRECGTLGLAAGATWRQGISPGWAAFSEPAAPGQQVSLAGVPDGVYWLVVSINPPGGGGPRLAETDLRNNTAASRIQIYGGGTKARLLGPMPIRTFGDWFDNPAGQSGQ